MHCLYCRKMSKGMQSLSTAEQHRLGEALTNRGLGIAVSLSTSIYETALTAVLSFPLDAGLIGCFYCPDTLLTTNLAICGHLMATQTSKGVSMLGKHFLRRCRRCCWPCGCCFRGCLYCRCSCKAHLGELHG